MGVAAGGGERRRGGLALLVVDERGGEGGDDVQGPSTRQSAQRGCGGQSSLGRSGGSKRS